MCEIQSNSTHGRADGARDHYSVTAVHWESGKAEDLTVARRAGYHGRDYLAGVPERASIKDPVNSTGKARWSPKNKKAWKCCGGRASIGKLMELCSLD